MATFDYPVKPAFGSARYSRPWVEEDSSDVSSSSSVSYTFSTPYYTTPNSIYGEAFPQSPWGYPNTSEQPRLAAAFDANPSSPAGACPIQPCDWRSASAPVSEEFVNSRAQRDNGRRAGVTQGSSSMAFSVPPSTASSPSHPNGNPKLPRILGLREQLLRASSIPTPQEFPGGSSVLTTQPRRKSASFLSNPSPSEQHLQQELSSQLQKAEHHWRQAEAEEEERPEEDVWFDPVHAPPSENLNWAEVEDLCASMDIAGMKVEEVSIFCPPASSLPQEDGSLDKVLLALKFTGMTLWHYPGDVQAKMLFSDIIGG